MNSVTPVCAPACVYRCIHIAELMHGSLTTYAAPFVPVVRSPTPYPCHYPSCKLKSPRARSFQAAFHHGGLFRALTH